MPPLLRLVLVAPLLGGCFVDGGPVDAASDGTGGTQGPGTTSVSASDPSAPTLTEPMTGESGDATGTTDPGMTATGDPTSTMCADPILQALDSTCSDASGCGCASEKCFIIPVVGGTCGQCLGDADCDGGGCTLPNPNAMLGTRCNKGAPGDGCESDVVCKTQQAPKCGEVYAVANFLSVKTCGQCTTSADCFVEAPLCSPTYDFLELGGMFMCVAAKSLADGQPCSLLGGNNMVEGDVACASGKCGQADYQGLFLVGVCGACKADADCMDGQTCVPPAVDVMTGTLTGARCT